MIGAQARPPRRTPSSSSPGTRPSWGWSPASPCVLRLSPSIHLWGALLCVIWDKLWQLVLSRYKESSMAKKAAYQKYLLKMIPFLKLLMYGPSKTYPFLRSECSNKTIQHRFHFLAWLIYLSLIKFIWIFWSTLSFARNKLSLFLFTQPYSAYEVFFERKLVSKCSVCFVYFEIRFNKVSNMGFSYLDKIRQKK